MFNYGEKYDDEHRIDLTDPWYKNEGLMSAIWFFIILAIGLVVLGVFNVW